MNALPQEARDDYLLNYLLDVESRGSLLSVEDSKKPFDYTLNVAVDSAGAFEPRKIDLVETFNYLIGLRVKQIDAQPQRGFVTVTGTLPSGESCVVLWRDCDVIGYEMLREYANRFDLEAANNPYDIIYVNGDHNIPAAYTPTTADEGVAWVHKLRQIEPEFLERHVLGGGAVMARSKANAKEGIGVDWPIRYKDLAPWYDVVEKFIGVSGTKQGLAHLPDGQFQPGMDLNIFEKEIAKKIGTHYKNNRHLFIGRVANLTSDLPGRSKCQYRNRCWEGCPYGGYFSTQSSPLPAALATRNLHIVTGAIAKQILYDKDNKKATGVEILDTEDNKTYDFKSKIIFVCASALIILG